MVSDGLHPSPDTLSCLISFAVEVKEFDRALGFFERLSEVATPSLRAYMTVLRVHSNGNDWPRSVALLEDMRRRNVPIDAPVLNIVLAIGVRMRYTDAAAALLKL